MGDMTPNSRIKPKSIPLNFPLTSSPANTAAAPTLPTSMSYEKLSPPCSPREAEGHLSRKPSMKNEAEFLRKISLPDIVRSPQHHPSPSPLMLQTRDNIPAPFTTQSNNPTSQSQTRGHRRGFGSRGSFDQSSSAITSFDSSETLISEEAVLGVGSGVSLSAKQVRLLFPFHIAVNYDFQMIQMGHALVNFLKQRTSIKIPSFEHIGKYFRIVSASSSTSLGSSTWDWFHLSSNHAEFASLSSSSSFSLLGNQTTNEITVEIELSKDFLLQETQVPIRLVGTLHKIHPKEDSDAVSYAALFLLSPKIRQVEDLNFWQTSELSFNNCYAENVQLLEEKKQAQEVISQQQILITNMENELAALRKQQQQFNVRNEESHTNGSNEAANTTTDVRQLIGNVTHDLKTPLGGFLNGIDSIKDYVEELSATLNALKRIESQTINVKQQNFPSVEGMSSSPTWSLTPFAELPKTRDIKRSPSKAFGSMTRLPSHREEESQTSEREELLLIESMEVKIDQINDKIKDITDINNFMTMTINRCIDYAKVGQNLKLKPKLETVQLAESLYLPLNCMKSLQTRISMVLEPIDENICSTVITDKQWLQENLLCLLSNAVKYSHAGEITVRMFLHPPPDASTTAKENLSAKKHITRVTEKQLQQFTLPRTNRRSFNNISRTSSLASSPLSHMKRTRSYTNDDYLSVRSPSCETGNTPRSKGHHTQHPSLDLSSHQRLKANDVTGSPISLLTAFDAMNGSTISTAETQATGHNALDRLSISMSASNKGSLTLDIPQLEYELFTNQFLVFEVEDRGTGIKEEVRETLFSPFQQAQRLAGGTGLGLFSLAKRIEALYGYYGVDARRDGQRGSLFWFAIPYRPDEESSKFLTSSKTLFSDLGKQLTNQSNLKTPVASYHQMMKVSPTKLSRLESMKTQSLLDIDEKPSEPTKQFHVLVVDDSVPIVKTVRHALMKKGYLVDTSHNGLDCLDKVQQRVSSLRQPYDVILMDLNMPILDGLEATRRLRQQEEENQDGIRHLIIGVSADSDEDTIVEALSAGVDDFICKPFSMDTFTSTLRKLKQIS